MSKTRTSTFTDYLICYLQLKRVRVCGPRYWPQVIEIVHEGRVDATGNVGHIYYYSLKMFL